MPEMIQLRNVPDDLHRKLKARAALKGLSISDYLLAEVRQAAERPTIGELRRRLRQRTSAAVSVAPARAVRDERAGEIAPERGEQALEDLGAFPIARYRHDVLLECMW